MKKLITLTISMFVICSCAEKPKIKTCTPDFFQFYSSNQISPQKFQENVYFFINPTAYKNKCGYSLITYTGLNNKISFFSCFGFLFCENDILYVAPLGSNKSLKLLDFKGSNHNTKICFKLPDQILEIRYHGYIKSSAMNYNENIFVVRICNIVFAYEHLFGDIVLFIGKQHGIIGLYFSTIIPDSFTDHINKGKEIIYHIQGDILLNEINYYNTAIFGKNQFYKNDSLKKEIESISMANDTNEMFYNLTFYRKKKKFPVESYSKEIWSNY